MNYWLNLVMFTEFGKVRMLEVLFHILEPLNPCICDLTNFLRFEELPLFTVKSLIKSYYMVCLLHIDESIPHIAKIIKINGKVKEVK